MKSVTEARDLHGVFPALFTPLLDDDPARLRNSIDHEKAQQMIDDLIECGATGLVPVGTTGQSPTVSHSQHVEFIKFTVDYVDGRVPVIAGAGSNCTRESVEMIESIHRACGDLACLCVTGYYNNPPQEGLGPALRDVGPGNRSEAAHLQHSWENEQLPRASHADPPGLQSQHHRIEAGSRFQIGRPVQR